MLSQPIAFIALTLIHLPVTPCVLIQPFRLLMAFLSALQCYSISNALTMPPVSKSVHPAPTATHHSSLFMPAASESFLNFGSEPPSPPSPSVQVSVLNPLFLISTLDSDLKARLAKQLTVQPIAISEVQLFLNTRQE